jgi:putative membrane protein
MSYLQGVPPFLLYFGMGIGFVALALTISLWLTPHREIALIREGNVAAAVALAGALIGYCLPLASALAHAVAPLDLAIWAGIALVAQLAAYALTRALLPGYPARIAAGETAAGITAAGLHVGVGLLNAAAMTY